MSFSCGIDTSNGVRSQVAADFTAGPAGRASTAVSELLCLCTWSRTGVLGPLFRCHSSLGVGSEVVIRFCQTTGWVVVCLLTFYICRRYFQPLVNNMSFVKYKEVYAAAAEVLGLILRYLTGKEKVSVLCTFI